LREECLWLESIFLSINLAHRVTKGNSSIAYLADKDGIHEGIKQIAEANGGRMMDSRILDVAFDSDDRSFMDLANMSIAKDIPFEHNI